MKQISLILLWAWFFNSPKALAKFYIHPKKSIQSFWGDAVSISEKSILLTGVQHQKAIQKAKVKFKSKLYRYYEVTKENQLIGRGFLISRKVRTQNISLLIVFNAKEELEFVETIRLGEPHEYKPKTKWMKQSFPKGLNREHLNTHTAHITGATMSARSVTEAVSWALSLREWVK